MIAQRIEVCHPPHRPWSISKYSLVLVVFVPQTRCLSESLKASSPFDPLFGMAECKRFRRGNVVHGSHFRRHEL